MLLLYLFKCLQLPGFGYFKFIQETAIAGLRSLAGTHNDGVRDGLLRVDQGSNANSGEKTGIFEFLSGLSRQKIILAVQQNEK